VTTWADLGLPYPEESGYGYTIDSGVVRTAIPAAQPRQRRDYDTNKRIFTCSWGLTHAQLRTAETYLQQNGYSWFPLKLLSGYLEDPVVTLCVRLIDGYDVSPLHHNRHRLTAQLEQLVERSVLVTTTLYPVEDIETGATSVRGLSFSGEVRSTSFYEQAAVGLPSTFSGSCVQTVFFHPIGPPAGQPIPLEGEPYPYPGADTYGRVYAEAGSTTLPAAFSGAVQQTVFWNNVTAEVEVAATSLSLAFSGDLVQTVFHAYVDATGNRCESAATALPSAFSGTLEVI
jgi:hypothetical protein